MILERCSYPEERTHYTGRPAMCGRHASLFYVLSSGAGPRVVGRCGMHKSAYLFLLCDRFREVSLEEARLAEVHCA